MDEKGQNKTLKGKQWIIAQEKEKIEGSKNSDKKIVIIKLQILNEKEE
jgi:hypothetical protein